MHCESTTEAPDITGDIVRALVLYCVAEYQAGHAKAIRVDAHGRSFAVSDDGRGHAIERTVGGAPYLEFVYTHLSYPFASGQSAPIQLQAIGISLANKLCTELSVTARKRTATLSLSFQNALRTSESLMNVAAEETGNTISGAVNPLLQSADTDTEALRQWLIRVLAASAGLRIVFNGLELRVPTSEPA
jgi:DNA gyrase/topoisomerase IV subunit B